MQAEAERQPENERSGRERTLSKKMKDATKRAKWSQGDDEGKIKGKESGERGYVCI